MPESRLTPLPTWTPAISGIPPLHHPSLDGIVVRSVCLIAEIAIDNPQYDQRATSIVEFILGGMGIEIVPDDQECEAVLRVRLSGNAIRASYTNVGSCFAGNRVIGDIALEIEGRDAVIIEVAFKTEPPTMISSNSCVRSASSVNFGTNCSKAVIAGLVDLWGAPVLGQIMPYTGAIQMALDRLAMMGDDPSAAVPDLILLLLDEDFYAACNAATTLGMLEPPPFEAVPWLIQALAVLSPTDEWESVGTGACHFNALKDITGQEFDTLELWQEWWDD
jgi:hypothetical protein